MPVGGESREVAVARVPSSSSRLLVLALLAADVAVFTAFGAYLLRRRLILPLQRLAAAARAIADGALHTRAPIEGVGETAEVATAFNEMTEALETRSRALEKAVTDLRESNHHLREAQAGLDRAERLASVGRLAAGVAHEVGNPMGAMLAFLDLAAREPGLSESGREHLSRAAGEGERVRKILRQLLDFSTPPRMARVAVDLTSVCQETAGLLRAQRRYAGIAVEVAQEGEAPAALADPGAVAQIVLNLLLNAADALRGHQISSPSIRVIVRPAVLRVRGGEGGEAAACRRHFDAVECVVEDNGPGIAAEDGERIFDPFFTSKDPGEGTGLGLSNALRFAEELGGSLVLDAGRDGPGAAFALRLPAVTGDSAAIVRGDVP
jgi:signal transduction histidine kinase